MRTCQNNYGMAMRNFRKAWESASYKDFPVVLSWVQKGANKVINYQNIYQKTPLITLSPLNIDNHNIIKFSGMTLIFLGMLGI